MEKANAQPREAAEASVGQTPGRQGEVRAPTRSAPFSFGMYGYLTLGLVLCMLVYFFGNPTLELSGQTPSSSTVPQQIPQPFLSPQLPQDQPILKPPTEAQKPVTMSTSERT